MTQSSQYDSIIEQCWQLFIKFKAKTNEDPESLIKGKIVTEIYKDQEFKSKLNGMMYRNNIPLSTGIADDVLAEVVIQLMKFSTKELFEAYCDSYRRVFALSMTIAVRCGFSKMNKDVHPNASVAKQILFKSNLNTSSYLCTNEELILNGDDKFYLPSNLDEEDMWLKIRERLNEEELQFLDFLFEKVLNKKYSQAYSRDLRKNYYSYNEYQVLRLALQNKIKEIIKSGL